MDLAAGARAVWVLMEHVDRGGAPRIVKACSLPVTRTPAWCSAIYTDLAVILVRPDGLLVTELAPGCTADQVQAHTGAPLAFADGLRS